MTAAQVEVQMAPRLRGVPPVGRFRRWARAALAALDRPRAELSIRVVDADESAALNRRYRQRAVPTNVLSFSADLPAELGLPLLGDLVICAPVVAREAAEQGKPAEAHWAHMVVHGVLHLLGHDHEADAEARVMEDLERRILSDLGFDDPYRQHHQPTEASHS